MEPVSKLERSMLLGFGFAILGGGESDTKNPAAKVRPHYHLKQSVFQTHQKSG